jgi:CheY-like chemotaxis protein
VLIIATKIGEMVNDREKCLSFGMDEHITKSVDFDRLRKALSPWLKL